MNETSEISLLHSFQQEQRSNDSNLAIVDCGGSPYGETILASDLCEDEVRDLLDVESEATCGDNADDVLVAVLGKDGNKAVYASSEKPSGQRREPFRMSFQELPDLPSPDEQISKPSSVSCGRSSGKLGPPAKASASAARAPVKKAKVLRVTTSPSLNQLPAPASPGMLHRSVESIASVSSSLVASRSQLCLQPIAPPVRSASPCPRFVPVLSKGSSSPPVKPPSLPVQLSPRVRCPSTISPPASLRKTTCYTTTMPPASPPMQLRHISPRSVSPQIKPGAVRAAASVMNWSSMGA